MTNPGWVPAWGSSDFEIQKENLVYDGIFSVKRFVLRHRLFRGDWSPWLQREFVKRQDAAAVILYDPLQNKVVMVEQFRVGLIEQPTEGSPWMLEIVAGLLEQGESAENSILREAAEEAGCEIKKLIKIGEFYNTPGGFSEKTTVFCGLVDVNGVEGIHGVDSEDEDILVHVLSTEWLYQAMDQGQLVTSASTMIAIQWLRQHSDGRKLIGIGKEYGTSI